MSKAKKARVPRTVKEFSDRPNRPHQPARWEVAGELYGCVLVVPLGRAADEAANDVGGMADDGVNPVGATRELIHKWLPRLCQDFAGFGEEKIDAMLWDAGGLMGPLASAVLRAIGAKGVSAGDLPTISSAPAARPGASTS